jgi:hypothetical protein
LVNKYHQGFPVWKPFFIFEIKNNMKRVVLFLLAMFALIFVNAQSFGLGAKGGLNFSKLSNENSLAYSATSSATGLVGGAWARVGFLGFFVQPEVLFTQRKGAFTSKVDSTAVINTLSYIDVPVLFGYKLLFLRLNAGPNFQFLVNAKQKATSVARDRTFSKDNFNNSNIGFQAGVGVDLLKISLDLRYDGSFGSIGKEIVTASGNKIDYSARSRMWQFTIGYKIF